MASTAGQHGQPQNMNAEQSIYCFRPCLRTNQIGRNTKYKHPRNTECLNTRPSPNPLSTWKPCDQFFSFQIMSEDKPDGEEYQCIPQTQWTWTPKTLCIAVQKYSENYKKHSSFLKTMWPVFLIPDHVRRQTGCGGVPPRVPPRRRPLRAEPTALLCAASLRRHAPHRKRNRSVLPENRKLFLEPKNIRLFQRPSCPHSTWFCSRWKGLWGKTHKKRFFCTTPLRVPETEQVSSSCKPERKWFLNPKKPER